MNRERALGFITGGSEIGRRNLARRREVLTECPSTHGSLEVVSRNTSSQTKMDPRHNLISGRSASSLELVRIRSNRSSISAAFVRVWMREGIVEQNLSTLPVMVFSSARNTLRGGLSGVPPVVRAGPRTRAAITPVSAYIGLLVVVKGHHRTGGADKSVGHLFVTG